MEVSGELHALAILPSGKEPQLYGWLGGPQSRSGLHVASAKNRILTVQHAARSYTDTCQGPDEK
jgi:hypothetical protein